MKEGQPKATRLKDYQPPPFLIEETRLRLDIHEDRTLVSARLQVRRNLAARARPADLWLDGGAGLATLSLALDGRELASNEYSLAEERLVIHGVPDSFELATQVEIRPQDNTALEGLYKSGDILCTQCEAEGFRNITWYLDRPDVMSKFTTTLSADKRRFPVLLAGGNDIERGEESSEEGKEGKKGKEGSRHWVTWQDPFKKPAYLFAVVAGNLECLEDSFTTMNGRQVALRLFTEAHNLDKLDHAMASLKHAMRWDEQAYGREYDLDTFMIVAVDSFNMGAMENKGLNIFNTACVLAHPSTTTDAAYQRVESVVAHEYFHNWSGNRVTCRDWFQLSLKEGFTVFRDQQFSADMGSASVCRVSDVALLRSVQFPEDAGPMAHPVRPAAYIEINNFYTPTVYEKGAEVVRMMHRLLGPARFRKGTDLYFDRHDGQAVTTDDFVQALEDASGMDLAQFRLWYSQAGTPVLKASGSHDAATGAYTLKLEQSCPATPGQARKAPFHLPVALGLLGPDGKDLPLRLRGEDASKAATTRVLELRKSSETYVFEGLPERPVPSLVRGFSAPVKLECGYSRDDLCFLMSHDSDGFARWEAGQRLAVAVIQEMAAALAQGQAPSPDARLVQAFSANLQEALARSKDKSHDKAMTAAMLALPSEAYLAELTEQVDIDAIHQAREALRSALAGQLEAAFLAVYRQNQSSAAYKPDAAQIAQRALKNLALAYLAQPADGKHLGLAEEQFRSASNMTDSSAGLRALVDSPAKAAEALKQQALVTFYQRWKHEPLVIDQWFAIQASCPLPGAMQTVEALRQHADFDMRVPNRMRALVAAFSVQNRVNFHRKDGAGYRFLADRVLELNGVNPQMAARILAPLSRWQKLDKRRQTLMQGELSRILEAEALSPDVYEIASKSLDARG